MILLDKDYALGKAENQYYLGYIDECTKNAIIKFLNSLPPAQPEQRWIPCSERLPDNDESVLISNSHGVTKAWWNGRFWTSIAVKKYKTVIAWMPLPEPYVERRKEWAQLTADGFYRLGNLSRANHMSIWRLHKNLQMAWLYTASLMIIFWIMGM